MRDELLNGEIFYSLREAQILIEKWSLSGHCNAMPCRSAGKHYNTKRPHSALGYRSPAPETISAMETSPVMH